MIKPCYIYLWKIYSLYVFYVSELLDVSLTPLLIAWNIRLGFQYGSNICVCS